MVQSRTARPSIAPSVVSTARRTPLGEARNVANVEIETMAPPPLPSLKGKEKAAKAVVRREPSSIPTAEKDNAVTAAPERTRKVVRTESESMRDKEREKQPSPSQPQTKSRAVSAPQDAAPRPRPSVGTSRAASNPHPNPHPPHPSLSRPPSSARGTTPAPIIEENENEDQDQDGHEHDEPVGDKWIEQPEGEDVHLSWALHVDSRAVPASVPGNPRAGPEDKPDWATVDELRREIGNLQLDMLRMGRNLKVSQGWASPEPDLTSSAHGIATCILQVLPQDAVCSRRRFRRLTPR
jgi:hypothetical protein